MKYVIKAQRDGWYFKEFQGISGTPVFGKIQDARLYVCKKDAISDMVRMGQYGQRVVALTKMGRRNNNGKKSGATSSF